MDTAKASREVYGNAKPRRRIRRLPEQPAATEQNAQKSERARQRQGTARGDPRPWAQRPRSGPPAGAQPPEPPLRRRTAERPGGPAAARAPGSTPPAAAVVLSCAAAQPGQRAASPPMLQTAPAGPAGDLAGTAAGILLLAGVITLLLPSNKAVENVPVGTEQTAQAGRLVAPVPMPTAMAPATAAQALTGEPLARCSRPKPILTPPPRRPPTWCRSLAG